MMHKRRRSRRLSLGYSQRPSPETIILFDIHGPCVKVLRLKSGGGRKNMMRGRVTVYCR
jgi:hypothetical protein